MNSVLNILLLLPILARGQIDIGVSNIGPGDANVTFRGSSIAPISPSERTEFQLTDWQLLSAVEKLSGGRPAEAFVAEPTPWKLYPSYKWNQVQRVLRPVSARILQLKYSPVSATTKFFDNRDFAGKSTFLGSTSLQKKTIFSSTWSSTTALSLDQEIQFSFDFGVVSGGSSTTFSYSNAWGEENSKSQSTTRATETEVEVVLEGGQAAVAMLNANSGELVLEVEYEASVRGHIAANYPDRYKEHYFWAYDVRAVLKAAGQPAAKRSKQTVRVGFYSDDSVSFYDYETGMALPSSAVSRK